MIQIINWVSCLCPPTASGFSLNGAQLARDALSVTLPFFVLVIDPSLLQHKK